MNYNQKVKKEFIKYLYRRNLSEGRIRKYMLVFDEIEKLKINLKRLTKNDIDKYFFYLMKSKYKEWTIVTKWKCFKRICKFVKNIDLSEWYIKTPNIEPEILSLDEIKAIIENLRNFRDRLIVMLLYESGMRISELLNLKKGDVIFDFYGALLRVHGKTGVRYIRVVKIAELLRIYINLSASERLFEITERAVLKNIKKACEKAGIKKRVYPHLFRHTRATHLAKYLTESELKAYFGWSKYSNMPAIYVHLSSRDVDEKIIKTSQIHDLQLKI